VNHSEGHSRLKRRHIEVLQRRHDFLLAAEATDTANSYERAERAALYAALGELRAILAARASERAEAGL